MNKLISLYTELSDMGVSFYHWTMHDCAAVTMEMQNKYSIFVDFGAIHTAAEEICTVAHEGGHVATCSTHRVYSKADLICRHEAAADRWAIKKLIRLDELKYAMKRGYTDPWNLSEYFGVTEKFMRKTLDYYTVNKGINFNEDYED